MISHKHKFIFIHIPKCGGTSIQFSLLKNEGVRWKRHNKYRNITLSLPDDQKVKFEIGYDDHNGTTLQHRKIDQYKNEKNYFTFTFVRNPWERFLSEFFYIKANEGCRCDEGEFNLKYPTFREFVIMEGSSCAWNSHEDPQIDFVLGTNHIDFVGRCEEMQRDFDIICDKIGIPQQELPRKNKSKHKHTHYTEYYDDETRQIVAEKYAKDIKYFGYEFGE